MTKEALQNHTNQTVKRAVSGNKHYKNNFDSLNVDCASLNLKI